MEEGSFEPLADVSGLLPAEYGEAAVSSEVDIDTATLGSKDGSPDGLDPGVDGLSEVGGTGDDEPEPTIPAPRKPSRNR